MKRIFDVRPAGIADYDGIARIYNQGIRSRQATFETRPRMASEIRSWFDENRVVQVAKSGERVVGFAAIFGYRDRKCYAGVGEFSVYVDEAWHACGVGKALMAALIGEAQRTGYWKILSRVFPENTACLSLLDSLAFRRVGRYRKHAQLDGTWRDVLIVERLLI